MIEKVSLDQGVLIGSKCKTQNDYEYTEFLQIPYAKPPVGELRFKNPQPPEKWEGERDASSSSSENVCYQIDILRKEKVGSEDCLYLNVYTPKLPEAGIKSFPVMVYIHGGGFVSGCGTRKSDFGPEFLIEQDVVIVAINYRLGIFGFLSLDIPEVTGNMGMKDQVMALKWVQNNIDKFGGDKDNVTIFGVSAGGAAVEYLILSPLSKGLFHKAIVQSGSALNHWALHCDAKALSIKAAQELGFQGSASDVQGVYDFLLQQSTDSLGSMTLRFINFFAAKGSCFGFVPSIEKDFCYGETFLKDHPLHILKEGKFQKVPVIRGFCNSEGLLISAMKPQILDELLDKKNFTHFWSTATDDDEIDQYNLRFKNVYFKEENTENSAIDFFGDYHFSSGIWIGSKLMAKHGVPVYSYIFSYSGGINIGKQMFFQNKTIEGASHGDDVGYIINYKMPFEVNPSETDFLVRKRMVRLWTDFAKFGNPVPSTSDLIPAEWPRFDSNQQQYLRIDKELTVESKYHPEKMIIFGDIYELLDH